MAFNTTYDVQTFHHLIGEGSQGFKPRSQRPEDVFHSGLGVCAGYANLVRRIADHTGDTVAVVSGHVRDVHSESGLMAHAWNAAKIEGSWYLLDATFDAGGLLGKETFQHRYKTQYLFAPPDQFIVSHRPRDERWQFVDEPVSLAQFLRGGAETNFLPDEDLPTARFTDPSRDNSRDVDVRDVSINPDNTRDSSGRGTSAIKDRSGEDTEVPSPFIDP